MKRAALLISTVALLSLGLAAPVLAAAPGNDTYGTSKVIGSLPFSDAVDTTEATTDSNDVEANLGCGAPLTDASVWYSLTLPSDTAVFVDTAGSDYAAGVIVVSGSAGTFAVQTCGTSVLLSATAGVTYSILVFDYDGVGNGGNLQLSVSIPPPPPVIHLTISPSGSFNARTGSATIRGTVICTGGDPIGKNTIGLQVTQTVGRFRFSAIGETSFICDGTTEPWAIQVWSLGGKFGGGKASVSAYANACGDFGCGFDEASRVVGLKK